MAGFREEDIRSVREANDLIELFSERVHLQRRGRDFWCCCPFHQEKTPSCKIDPINQTWHCFGCGEGGDVFTYVEKTDDVDFVDALKYLARRANIELHENRGATRAHSKKARLRDICAKAAEFYHRMLMRSADVGADEARNYLAGRGLNKDIPKRWNLGYAPGHGSLVSYLVSEGFTPNEMIEANLAFRSKRNGQLTDRFNERIMFPINDQRGECIAFGGRIIKEGEPKYLNSSDTPIFHKSEVLYGLDKAKAKMASSGCAIVVEGYTDVIALHEAGFENCVATLGTALTRQHIRILSHHAKSRIVYLFDGDAAGQRAADRALGFIDKAITPEAGVNRIDLFALTLPDNLDPAEYIVEYGAAQLESLLDNAVPLLEYGISRRIERYDVSSPEGRIRAANDALSIFAPIKDSLLAKEYALSIANRLQLKEEDILSNLSSLKVAPRVDEQESNGDISTQRARQNLSKNEINRLKLEREFLSLCAQNPAMTPEFYPTLLQTMWHDPLHSTIAEILVDIVSNNPSVTVGDLLSEADKRNPKAKRILTATLTQGFASAHNNLVYLSEDLLIGDRQQALMEMRARLKDDQNLSADDEQILFEALIALQKDLNQLRAQHGNQEL